MNQLAATANDVRHVSFAFMALGDEQRVAQSADYAGGRCRSENLSMKEKENADSRFTQNADVARFCIF